MNLRFLIAAAAALASLTPACAQTEKPAPAPGDAVQHVNLTAAAAKELLATDAEKKITVLDVRTPDEFKEGHIAGAKLVDFKAGDFDAKLAELDRDKTYLVHCRSGRRSSSAFAKMKELGFTSVYHLDGGILAWEEADGETTTGE